MESKFWKLRKQLDDLGYRQILVPESVPLVEKLLADLIQTTESLQKYMKIAKEAIEERDILQSGAEPYKCDNAKLVKECNDLHLTFLQYREQNEKIQRELKQRISDLQLDKINSDREVEKLRKQIRTLQFDLTKKTEHISAPSKKSSGKLTSKSTPSVSILKQRPPVKPKDTFESDSAMALANDKIAKLTKEIKKLKDEQLRLVDTNETYRNQLCNRDREIERLTAMLEGGRPRQAVNRDCCHQDINCKLAQLHDEVTSLKNVKASLEEHLKEAIEKQHEAMKRALCLAERNKQLEKEMKNIDQLALAVEAECNSTVKNNADKLNRMQERMHNTILQIQKLEKELADTKREKQELMADFNALQVEKKHLQTVLETALEEKKSLNDRLNQYTIIERDLNKEIDRLMQLSASQKQKIAELECKVMSEKFDFIKDKSPKSKRKTQKKEKSSKATVTSKNTSPPLSPMVSPTKIYPRPAGKKCTCNCKSDREIQEIKTYERLKSQKSKISRSSSESSEETKKEGDKRRCSCCRCNNCVEEIKRLLEVELHNRQGQDSSTKLAQEELQHLRTEKEYYMKEYHRVLEQIKNIPSKPDVDNTDFVRKLSEKENDLVQKLHEKEQLIESLQHENKNLAQEKYNLMTRLETTRDRPDTDFESLSMRSIVKRLERERELLKGDIERLEEERDALRQRLKTMVETQVGEHARLEKTIMESEEHVRRLEQERRDLIHSQGSRRATITNLEEQCEVLRDQLRTVQTELNQQHTIYAQLKNLHEQTDRALADAQGRIIQLETQLMNSQDKTRNTDDERIKLEKELCTLRNDLMLMRGNLAQIDQEKDTLLIAIDDKTERVAHLEQNVKEKDRTIQSLEETVAELKKKLSLTADDSTIKNNMYKTLKSEMSNLRQELEAAIISKDLALQENRRLQDDLASCTSDCRNARNELEITKRQVEDLKMQLQHYVAEVKRAEDLISQKETERSEMLDQFRNLNNETLKLENNNHTLENEATQTKIQLSVALDHAAELERQLESQETMIRSYERQISDLTSQVASLEVQARQHKAQKQHAEDELQTVRDLCVKVDKQKDEMLRQIEQFDKTRVQMERDLTHLQKECETLQDALSREKSNMKKLDKLLSESRQETIEQRALNQDLRDQIQSLQNKIDDLQRTLTTTTEQLDLYQVKALDYNQQNKQLRRELANERFYKSKISLLRRRPIEKSHTPRRSMEKRHEVELNAKFHNTERFSLPKSGSLEGDSKDSPKRQIRDSLTLPRMKQFSHTPIHQNKDYGSENISDLDQTLSLRSNNQKYSHKGKFIDDISEEKTYSPRDYSFKKCECCTNCNSVKERNARFTPCTCCDGCAGLQNTEKNNYSFIAASSPYDKNRHAVNVTFTTSGLTVHTHTSTYTHSRFGDDASS